MAATAGKVKQAAKGAGRKEQVRTSTLEAPAKDLQYITVPTDSIVIGTFNPRHTFDEARMEELTASVRAKGVLEPLLVRPLAKPKGKAKYELIAGERRWRAALRAKRASVPVGVGDFSDQEALEIAVIENEQRADVPILEKAEGYQRLMKQYGYSAEVLAARIHKSEAEVHATVKLLRMPDWTKKYLNDGVITRSHGEIIARVPNEQGREALAKKIIFGNFGGKTPNVCSVRQAKGFADDFTKELSKAPFDTTDENLIEGVGACTTCPFKSGNNRLEYPEGRADICNNVACFNRKVEAGNALKLAALTEGKGAIPLTKEEIKKYLPYGYLMSSSPYIELKNTCHQDKRYRTYRQLVGKELGKSVKLYVALEEHDGKVIELALKKEVGECLKRVHNIDLSGRAGAGKEAAERRLKSQARGQAVFKALEAVAEHFRKQSIGGFSAKFDKVLRLAAILMVHNVSNDGLRDVAKRRGVEVKGHYPRFSDELTKVAASLSGPELFGLLMEAGVAESLFYWRGPYGSTLNKRAQETLKAASVDLSALEAAEIKALKEKRAARAKKATKKTSGKKSGSRGAPSAKIGSK